MTVEPGYDNEKRSEQKILFAGRRVARNYLDYLDFCTVCFRVKPPSLM